MLNGDILLQKLKLVVVTEEELHRGDGGKQLI
jgi:hypothetical protein